MLKSLLENARSVVAPKRGGGAGSSPATAAAARPSPPPESPAFADIARTAFATNPERPLCLYAHVPFCRHRCTFCPFYLNLCYQDFSAHYAKLLEYEIHLTAEILGELRHTRPVHALYFGGGTPGDLEAEDLARLLRALRDQFTFTPETEVTVEGRIRDFTPAKGRAWTEAGANRFSLGLQSTDTALRRRLGRLADREEIRRVLNDLGESGAVLIVDLIYGLPGQVTGSIAEDIRFLAEETPLDGLDLYALRRFPQAPLEQAVASGRLPPFPDEAEKNALLAEGEAALRQYGFEPFSPRHWRRTPRERSLYNQCAQREADILPFGSAAGGRLGPYQISSERAYEAYIEALQNARKPVTVMRPPPATAQQPRNRE